MFKKGYNKLVAFRAWIEVGYILCIRNEKSAYCIYSSGFLLFFYTVLSSDLSSGKV